MVYIALAFMVACIIGASASYPRDKAEVKELPQVPVVEEVIEK